MAELEEFQMPVPHPALRRLDFLVGQWKVHGPIFDEPGAQIRGLEWFEWLQGGFFLVHRWQRVLVVGGREVADAGYQFLDYDGHRERYRAHFFSSFGPYDEETSVHTGLFHGNALVVTGASRVTHRPTGDGALSCETEVPNAIGGWSPWIHASLTKARTLSL
jgi:hypothetical protein